MTKKKFIEYLVDMADISHLSTNTINIIKSRYNAKSKDMLDRHYEFVSHSDDQVKDARYSILVATGIDIH